MNKFWTISSVLLSLYSFKDFHSCSSLINARKRCFLFFGQSTQAEGMGDTSAASQNNCQYVSIKILLLWLIFPLIKYLFLHFNIYVYLEAI